MEYIKKLQEFLAAVDKSTLELRDNLYNDDYKYDSKHDITITMDGASITMSNNADLYCNLSDMILVEITNEHDKLYSKLKWFADMQERVFNFDDGQDWFITFDWYGMKLLQPFKSPMLITSEDPLQFYGKSYSLSDWPSKAIELMTKLTKTANDFTGFETDDIAEAFAGFMYKVSTKIEYKEAFKSQLEIVGFMQGHEDSAECFNLLVRLSNVPEPSDYYAALIEEGVDVKF